jgi:hypothetical protein
MSGCDTTIVIFVVLSLVVGGVAGRVLGAIWDFWS